jgi:hypothetical protein
VVNSAYSVDKASLFDKLGYTPMEHQWQYHNSPARFRCVCCGRRTGKTTMAGHDRVADLLRPKTLGWIVGPTYNLGAKEFRVMWDALIIELGLGRDKRVKKNFNLKQGDMYIEMPWGSRVEVRSAAHPDTLVGDGLDWVIMAEAAKHNADTWEKYVRPALSDKRGGADFVTTPEGKNWFYKLWLLYKTKREYESWRFPSWVNTEVYPGGENDPEIQQMRETTLEEWFLQEIAAEFTAIVGRIFGEFAEEDNVRPHKFNPEWPNYIMFDWGFTAPLAAMEVQISPRDEVFVWREHYVTNRTLEWHIAELKSREQPAGYRLDGAFGDAADPEAVEYVSQHLIACQADPDSKLWLTGIRLMKSFLKLQHDGVSYDDNEVPILRPRYWVDPSCEEHIGEMLGYKAKQGANANEFKGAGVVANGVADHSIDAIRYGLMHLYSVGVQHHLDEVYPEWAKAPRERIEAKTKIPSDKHAVSRPTRELQTASSGRGTFFSFNSGGPSGRF